MKDTDFDFLSNFVESRSGIVLHKDKAYLIESRLAPVIKSEGFGSLSDLILRLRWQATGELVDKVIDAMTTNETFFFRDNPPFEALKTGIIKDLIEKRQSTKTLNIWSAACSSGQEPYSISILLREHFPILNDWTIRILGTDVSDEVLEKADKGIYSSFEVSRGLNDMLVKRYFEPVDSRFKVRQSLRDRIEFKKLNLMDSFAQIPKMDVIFLRNVLIYFKQEVKRDIVGRIIERLMPDGYLFLGQSETAKTLSDQLEPVNIASASCFVKSGAVVSF